MKNPSQNPSEDFGRQLSRLSDAFQQAMAAGDAGEAVRLAQQMVAIARRSLSPEHPDFAVTLSNLGAAHFANGDASQAVDRLREALRILQQAHGEHDAKTVGTLANLASICRQSGRWHDAMIYYESLIRIQQTLHGRQVGLVQPLTNLGDVYRQSGRLNDAFAVVRQAYEIQREADGEGAEFARCAHNLGYLLLQRAEYGRAEQLLLQAGSIRRKRLGASHPELATTLEGLATLYQRVGQMDRAKTYFERVLRIRKAALGESHPDYAQGLNNLALLFADTGQFREAETLYRQALAIHRGHDGESHPQVATILNNLGELLRQREEYGAAAPLFIEAIRIRHATQGHRHPDVAANLNNLGLTYKQLGQFAEAAPRFAEALSIVREQLGDHHPTAAGILNNLAEMHRAEGDYPAAVKLLREALAIDEASGGTRHFNYAIDLANLAKVHAAQGQSEEALRRLQQSAEIADELVRQLFACSSDAQRMQVLDFVRTDLDLRLSLVLRDFSVSPTVIPQTLDLVLRRKGIGFEVLAAQRDVQLGRRYPHLEERWNELVRLRRQITSLTMQDPSAIPVDELQQLAAWMDRRESLEVELAREIPELDIQARLRAADRRAVALALPENVALVEFVRFREYDFSAIATRGESYWKPPRYVAFVLLAGQPDDVRMIDLGPADPIDQLIVDFRASVIGDSPNRDMIRRDASVTATAGADRQLHEILWSRLQPALDGCASVVLSPDGDLNLLPLEVLVDETGHRLIEHWQFSYVAVGRDIVRSLDAPRGSSGPPLVIADPDFDLCSVSLAAPSPSRLRSTDAASFNTLICPPLPATRAEGSEIAALLGVQPWLGGDVLEQRIKQVRSPHVLHIATHGYFCDDLAELGLGRPRQTYEPMSERFTSARHEMSSSPTVARAWSNPLLRSGLALAGVNSWLKGMAVPPEAEDGVLTAEDVCDLELSATELVVLSACDTGLGRVHVGEGVFGLRRAFALAGAETLVVSLWRVPDEQTRELMILFYRRLLSGHPRAAALRAAQLELQAAHADPFYWGAFICQGYPGALLRQPSADPRMDSQAVPSAASESSSPAAHRSDEAQQEATKNVSKDTHDAESETSLLVKGHYGAETAPVRLLCPHCHRRLKVRKKKLPPKVRCPACTQVFDVSSALETFPSSRSPVDPVCPDLDTTSIGPEILDLVPASVARENQVLPLSFAADVLTVAMADRNALDVLDKLRFILNVPVVGIEAPPGKIQDAIERFYGSGETESTEPTLPESADQSSGVVLAEKAAAQAIVPHACSITYGDSCIIGLDDDHRGVVIVRESLVDEALTSSDRKLTPDRAAAGLAAQLSLLARYQPLASESLVLLAAAMVEQARVRHLVSLEGVIPQVPPGWHTPVYYVTFGGDEHDPFEPPICRQMKWFLKQAAARRAAELHLAPSVDALHVVFRFPNGTNQTFHSLPPELLKPLRNILRGMADARGRGMLQFDESRIEFSVRSSRSHLDEREVVKLQYPGIAPQPRPASPGEASKLRVRCPHCHRYVSGSLKHLGRKVNCPGCAQPFPFDPSDHVSSLPTFNPLTCRLDGVRPSQLINDQIAWNYGVLPLTADGDTLHVAIAQGSEDHQAKISDMLQFILERPIDAIEAPVEQLKQAITREYPRDASESEIAEKRDTSSATNVEWSPGELIADIQSLGLAAKMLHYLVLLGIREDAVAIYFYPNGRGYQIFARTPESQCPFEWVSPDDCQSDSADEADGPLCVVLHEASGTWYMGRLASELRQDPDHRSLGAAIMNYLKVVATRDGTISLPSLRLPGVVPHFRVQFQQRLHGEAALLRLSGGFGDYRGCPHCGVELGSPMLSKSGLAVSVCPSCSREPVAHNSQARYAWREVRCDNCGKTNPRRGTILCPYCGHDHALRERRSKPKQAPTFTLPFTARHWPLEEM
jgi:CHAT domain-containing protein/tetratricopeptide (TPR) repeat protein/type II secretory ATPase GspE/PulE/Tfp pilus assembly ATPase PilB-like protein